MLDKINLLYIRIFKWFSFLCPHNKPKALQFNVPFSGSKRVVFVTRGEKKKNMWKWILFIFPFCLLATFKHPCWSWLVFACLVYTAVSCDIIISKVRHHHIINSHWNLNIATNLDWSLPVAKNLYSAVHCGRKVTGRACRSFRVNETKALRVSSDSRWWKVPDDLKASFFQPLW